MGVTSWIAKKVLARKMPGATEEMVEQMMQLLKDHPELATLFQKIGTEVEERVKKGEHQMFATMEVTKKYQAQLQAIAQKNPEAFAAMQGMMRGSL